MAFRFSLAAVLTYREALEQRELAALEKAQQEVALLETQIRQAEGDLCRLERRREEELKRGMPSIHLQDAIEQEHAVNRLQKDLTKKLEDLRVRRQDIFKAYEEARQKRQLLEKLRSRRLSEYTREQARAEQAAIDDLFLARWKQSQ
jgi:flagellar export protein FliJ